MAEITQGQIAGEGMSYLLQMLYEINMELISGEPDEDFISHRLEILADTIHKLGANGKHQSKMTLPLDDGMVITAELFITHRPDEG